MIVRCVYRKMVPVGELKAHPQNCNDHPKDQVQRLAKILNYQGWRWCIKVSNQSGFITGGHGRLEAAKLNQWTEVPVDFQDYDTPDQEYLDVVADNQIANWAEFRTDEVTATLAQMKNVDIDLAGIKDFRLPEITKAEPGCDEDAVPEVKEPIAKLGDIWKLGKHRLMCGDSVGIHSVESLMAGEKADMVFTDPPYGVSYQSNMRTKSDKFDVIANDETFLSEWINILPIVSQGWVFVWTTWKVLTKWLEITGPIGEMSNMIIWDKGGGGIGDLDKTFSTDYEIALVFHRGAKITGKRLGSVWSVGKDRSADYVHPTQKPVELAQMALENCTKRSDKVLDLFGGSGSTLIACEKTKRKCFMMELDPHYVDVIIARWEKYTGQKAELLNGTPKN